MYHVEREAAIDEQEQVGQVMLHLYCDERQEKIKKLNGERKHAFTSIYLCRLLKRE